MLLINGQTVPDSDVEWHVEANTGYIRFDQISTGADLTNQIKRMDKLRLVPNFDVDKENIRVSEELGAQSGLGSEPLDTNVGSILVDQIENDGLLAAPLETLDNTVKKVFSSSGVKTILVLAGVGLVVYFAVRNK